MRKLISKIKKVVVLIIGVIIALPSKIFAYTYKIPTAVPVYGIPEPKPIEVIWKYARVTIIPLALIVGLIVVFAATSIFKLLMGITTTS